MWMIHTRDREPSWCTALIFPRADGQFFMPHWIVHHSENCTQNIHYNIPKYCLVHNTPSRYIYRDGWTKSMMNFKTVCGANKLNLQVLFYDGHDSHFDNMSVHILRSHHIKPFVLKAGDSVNDQPNDNGPNIKPKGLYGQTRIN